MRTFRILLFISVVGLSLAGIGLAASPAAAQNVAPAKGAILDLGQQTVQSAAQSIASPYSVTFVAPSDTTSITFSFRDNSDFILFSQVSLVDITTGSKTNLLTNGDFSNGAAGWTSKNISGVDYFGKVVSPCSAFGSCWADGTVQGYDELSQTVTTVTKGDEYQLSFSATQFSVEYAAADTGTGPDVWSSVSTNGGAGSDGNGADILAYVGGIDGPYGGTPAPELSTWVMLLAGFFGLGVAGRRRALRSPSA